MNEQDWYLNQLDITQYILRKPSAMKGESSINIAENIRLIVITKSVPNDKIFDDILNAIHVNKEDCLILSPTQLLILPEQLNHVIWFIDEALPNNWQTSPVLTDKAIIKTVSLSKLASSPNLKCQLWHSLCQYERYFNTH